MDCLSQNASKIRIPSENDKVYKDECVVSFDKPETETGLYVCLSTFLGFGRDWVETYHQVSKNSVFLHIKRIRHEVSSPPQGDGPEKKITRLAIGVDGGFDPDSGRKKYEFEDIHEIVVLPSFVSVAWPNAELPEIVRASVQAILDLPSASKLAELQALSGTWDGEARVVSRHANNLQQLENNKKIPPSGWKCEQCDKTDNLWLNLTDGAILCGRKFFDGSGGNNHAIDHYKVTGYPLAVKLGTITKEGKADVFSYTEDDMVEDPNLIQHLQHWGINMANMEKTEKSMIELELELNQQSNEWATLQESGVQLKPLFGAGYTGLTNMGNSCYLSSLVQVLFTIPDFIDTYYRNGKTILNQFLTANPAENFNVQMAKLADGLLSGKYSVNPGPNSSEIPSIAPQMFKTLVGKGHSEFSTKKQQDVQEFLLYLLTLLERNNKGKTNPGDCFKFTIEERYQCNPSKKVKYLTRSDVILPLTIPMDAAINKDEVAAYEARKAEAEAQSKKLEPEALVRPKIRFFSCLEFFSQSELINNFYSSAVNQNVTARKTTRLSTFPKYLVIQLKKFTLREDWVPIKLDVSIDMPDMLDITSLKGRGLQPDEELLPDLEASPALPVFDENVISQLVDMGFPPDACKRAVYFTHNSGLEAATAWVMEHIADTNFSDPFVIPGSEKAKFTPNSEALAMIVGMGFSSDQATKALQATDNNVERAMDWIFSHQDEISSDGNDGAAASPPVEVDNGDGKYKLFAFISHMGTSSMVGHYVAHILKDGQWVIFNDEKVALSENPPKDLGYLYFYERV